MEKHLHWSVHVVADDLFATLPETLRALEAAESRPSSITVVDNAPVGQPRTDLVWPELRWLRNPRPQTPGRSHNQALELAFAHPQTDSDHEIALLLTPDVIVSSDLLSRLGSAFQADRSLAVISPKMHQAHITGSLDGERRDIEFTEAPDEGNAKGMLSRLFSQNTSGPSPSCFAVRLSALWAVAPSGPWFQETENWDAAALGLFRRLKNAGFTLTIAPYAVSWRLTARA